MKSISYIIMVDGATEDMSWKDTNNIPGPDAFMLNTSNSMNPADPVNYLVYYGPLQVYQGIPNCNYHIVRGFYSYFNLFTSWSPPETYWP